MKQGKFVLADYRSNRSNWSINLIFYHFGLHDTGTWPNTKYLFKSVVFESLKFPYSCLQKSMPINIGIGHTVPLYTTSLAKCQKFGTGISFTVYIIGLILIVN